MADVRPFRALRYAAGLDLGGAICPPFDIISPEEQLSFHERTAYNAVRIELAQGDDGSRYRRAAETLSRWRDDGTLERDETPVFYLYDQQFERDGFPYRRRLIFARLRLEPWDKGIVLPHEQTFGAPKEDRLRLLRTIRTNTSPVFLIYRDHDRAIEAQFEGPAPAPVAEFTGDDGQTHTFCRIDDPRTVEALTAAFELETLYIADGHHRYETALGYREECRENAVEWTGYESENFALVALTSASDPGLLVLPIHRVAAAGIPLDAALDRMSGLFEVEHLSSLESLTSRLAERRESTPSFGLASAESKDLVLISVSDAKAVDALLPQDRSVSWRSLDYAIANHVILQRVLGVEELQMSDYATLWFTEDAEQAVDEVRGGRARYAVLMNPVPVTRVLDVADSGERMPQKSTFFYPKVPTGLVFNPIED